MDLNRLIEFNLIADLGSFTKAAERLGVSTAVLSARFSKFEDQIGQRLLDRNCRTIELTDAGERFIADSREIINDYNLSVRRGRNTVSDRLDLTIGVEGMGLPARVQSILTELNEKYLSLQLSLTDSVLWSDLLDGDIQLYIGPNEPNTDPRLGKLRFGSCKQFAVIPRGHKLFGKPKVELEDLNGERLLLYPANGIGGIRRAQRDMLLGTGLNYTLVENKISASFFYDYVSMGLAIGLVPLFNWPSQLYSDLAIVPLESKNSALDIYMYYLRENISPVLNYILSKLERRRNTLDDYGLAEDNDN